MKQEYDVWLFPVVKVKVTCIEADSQIEAIKKARHEIDMELLLTDRMAGLEFADEFIPDVLVDVRGDETYEMSQWWTERPNGEFRPKYKQNPAPNKVESSNEPSP